MDEMLCTRLRKRITIELNRLDRARASSDTLRNQHMTLNSSGSGRSAGSMRSLQRNAPSQGRLGQSLGLDRSRRLKYAEMGKGSSGGSAAEWTIAEIAMPPRLVRSAGLSRVVVRRCWQLKPLRADFQQERRTACRHEAERHIGSKQKHDQRQTGCQVSPLINE
jgi:hypothetical protein